MKLAKAILLTMALLLFAIAACAQSRSAETLTGKVGVGDLAPDFTLKDHQQGKVTLSDTRGKSSVVLVFYRGYW